MRQQLQSELQLARAEAAARAVEAGDLGARLAARTAELAVARQQAAALQAAAAEVGGKAWEGSRHGWLQG